MSLSRKKKWAASALVVVVLATVAAVLLVRDDPFWLVERGTDIYLWQNGVHHREIMVDGHRIHYLEAVPRRGKVDNPIVLVHGLGARASDWAAMIPALARNGRHVYAVDLLGYGRSDKPADGDFTLSGEEQIVRGFVDALHLKQTDVAGWSMGGWIATKYALDRPAQVRRLLLFDSAGLYMPIDFPLGMFNPSTPAELDLLLGRIEPDKRIIYIPSFAVPGLLRMKQHDAWIVNDSLGSMLDGHEILDFRVHALKMPVLLMWGDEDKLTPLSTALRLHDLIPKSVLVELAGCGHLAAAECSSQAIPPTLQFLAADPPPPPSVTIIPSKQR